MRAAAVLVHTLASISRRGSRVMLALSLLMSASLFAQNISVLPGSLTFAKQAVGSTSAGQAVTITNNGLSAQAVVIASSGDFSESDNCAGNIAGGGSCSMNVFFAPPI